MTEFISDFDMDEALEEMKATRQRFLDRLKNAEEEGLTVKLAHHEVVWLNKFLNKNPELKETI